MILFLLNYYHGWIVNTIWPRVSYSKQLQESKTALLLYTRSYSCKQGNGYHCEKVKSDLKIAILATATTFHDRMLYIGVLPAPQSPLGYASGPDRLCLLHKPKFLQHLLYYLATCTFLRIFHLMLTCTSHYCCCSLFTVLSIAMATYSTSFRQRSWKTTTRRLSTCAWKIAKVQPLTHDLILSINLFCFC